MVAQVEKQQSAMVAHPVHPARHPRVLANVGLAQGAAGMAAIGVELDRRRRHFGSWRVRGAFPFAGSFFLSALSAMASILMKSPAKSNPHRAFSSARRNHDACLGGWDARPARVSQRAYERQKLDLGAKSAWPTVFVKTRSLAGDKFGALRYIMEKKNSSAHANHNHNTRTLSRLRAARPVRVRGRRHRIHAGDDVLAEAVSYTDGQRERGGDCRPPRDGH